MKLKIFFASLIFSVLLTLPHATLAEVEPGFPGGDTGTPTAPSPSSPGSASKDLSPLNPKFENPLKATSFGQLLNAIIKILITVGIPIAILFIIYSGFLFVTARGSEDQIKKAKTTLLWTLVGIAVLLGASIIGAVLENTINSITKPPTP
ncbi:MAG TPA: pilin [Candidatus Paceibacterota bacterium]